MTNYPYDPELPYAVIQVYSEDEIEFPTGSINARFRDAESAREYADGFLPDYVELVDTTPAPKIPADAEFIFWYDYGLMPFYARRYGNTFNRVWERESGATISEVDLVKQIGDAEVVVLKRA